MKWYFAAGIWLCLFGICFAAIYFFAPDISPVEEDVGDQGTLRFVSGTEYNIGEAGQVIAEVRKNDGSPIPGTNCSFTVWYPDKTQFLQQYGATGPSGNQYVNFTIPGITGVYEYQANCSWNPGKTSIASKSFHVSEFQNETLTKLRRIRAESIR